MAAKKTPHYGEAIASLREDAGWTVYRLAKESGVDPSALYRIEAGAQVPSIATMHSLTRTLGQSLAVLDGCSAPEK